MVELFQGGHPALVTIDMTSKQLASTVSTRGKISHGHRTFTYGSLMRTVPCMIVALGLSIDWLLIWLVKVIAMSSAIVERFPSYKYPPKSNVVPNILEVLESCLTTITSRRDVTKFQIWSSEIFVTLNVCPVELAIS